MSVEIYQEIITIAPKSRGFHLITQELLQASDILSHHALTGLLHLLLLHTSASLTLNENTDSAVLHDFEAISNALVPENFPQFIHTYEGSDDMPAHVKSSLYGVSLSIPIKESRLILGTWQGVYLNEHRNRGGRRKIALTIIGTEG